MLGGVSRAVETARLALERLGHETVVVAPSTRGALDPTARVIRVPSVPAPTYPDFALPLPLGPGLARRILDLELDVFHAQHPFLLGATARRLARAARRPLLFTYHTRYDKYAHYVPLPRPLVARHAIAWSTAFANTADTVIVPSAALAAQLASQGIRRPIEVIPTGVDLDRFRPGAPEVARQRLDIPPEVPLVLYVGRLDREKNLAFLLDAFELVAARHPSVHLALVGRGMQEPVLRRHAARGAAGGRVRFVGGVAPDAVAGYYRAADLFVFCSTTETQGLAVLEAMASGCPVVAVRAPGVEEAVVDGVGGLLVPEDRGIFAGAVLQVLGDAGLAAKLATGAREGARPFATAVLGARLVEVYERVRARFRR